MSYKPGGYSWLGISPEPKNVPMTEKEKSRLDDDLELMEGCARNLEAKIKRYHSLCVTYETEAGSHKGAEIYEELKVLKGEIHALSIKLSHTLDDTGDITHL